jgi:tripartite-type tricarboxylate transporter receptor subunit TctC
MSITPLSKSGKMDRRSFLAGAAAVPLAVALPPPGARAQSPWPARNLTMIVPFPPGGQADLAARPVALALEKSLGRPVVVENRPGAGGAIGAAAVAKAEPDGHTLLMTLNSIVVSPEAERLHDRAPLYELNQLVPVARVLSDPNIFAVRSSAPWKTLQDLVEDARRRPGVITFSSSGNFGAAHVSVEAFTHAAGIKLLHVPYRGAGPAITGLLADQVGLTSTTLGTLAAHVEAGTIRILAAMSAARIRRLPDVPTMREAGYPVEANVWAGLFLPSGVPEPVVGRIRGAMRGALADPMVISVFQKAGTDPAYQDAPEFAKLVAADHAILTATIKKIGRLE